MDPILKEHIVDDYRLELIQLISDRLNANVEIDYDCIIMCQTDFDTLYSSNMFKLISNIHASSAEDWIKVYDKKIVIEECRRPGDISFAIIPKIRKESVVENRIESIRSRIRHQKEQIFAYREEQKVKIIDNRPFIKNTDSVYRNSLMFPDF